MVWGQSWFWIWVLQVGKCSISPWPIWLPKRLSWFDCTSSRFVSLLGWWSVQVVRLWLSSGAGPLITLHWSLLLYGGLWVCLGQNAMVFSTWSTQIQNHDCPQITSTVTCPLSMFLQKMMQRVQNATVCFALNRYCSKEDDLKLSWLPTLGNTQLNILKFGHCALYNNNNNWREYLTLSRHNPSRTLRSSSATLLQISLLKGIFQDSVANCTMIFSRLPSFC